MARTRTLVTALLAVGLIAVSHPVGAVQTPGANGRIIFANDGVGLASVDATGGNRLLIPGSQTADQDPSWAPNGTFIVFGNSGAIVRSAPDGTNRVTLAATGSSSPAVSPDSTRVVFQCSTGICTTNANGTGATLAVPNTAGGLGPDFTPDGTQIVFGAGTGIQRVPVAGGTILPIPGTVGGDYNPALTPDGATVLFDTAGGIVALPFPAGGTRVTLAGTATGDKRPAPSPDGTAVVFDNDSGLGGLFVVPTPAGGTRTELLTTNATDTSPSWGKFVAPAPGTNVPPVFSAASLCGGTAMLSILGATTTAVSASDTAGQTVTLAATTLSPVLAFATVPGNPATGTISIAAGASFFDLLWALLGSPAQATITATDNGVPAASSACQRTIRVGLF